MLESIFKDASILEMRPYLVKLREFMDWKDIHYFTEWITYRSLLAADVLGIDINTTEGAGDLGVITRHEFAHWLPFMMSFMHAEMKKDGYSLAKSCLYFCNLDSNPERLRADVERDYAGIAQYVKQGGTHGIQRQTGTVTESGQAQSENTS